jgi:hypothetical protein
MNEEVIKSWKTCDVCGNSYDSLAGISCHLRNTGHSEYKKFTQKPCQQCGEKFQVKKSAVINDKAAKYCSADCRRESLRDRVVLTCKNCGNDFSVVKSKSNNRKYCSDQCTKTDEDYCKNLSNTKQQKLEKDAEYRKRVKQQGKKVGMISPSKEAIQKRLNTIQNRYSDDQIYGWCSQGGSTGEPWNKGMTKEDDERIQRAAKKLVGHDPFHGCGWGKGGFREDIGHYVRSIWEANIARVYQYLSWDYEYEPNSFELGDKSTYRPDFYLPQFEWYIEISGYVSDKKLWKVDQFRKLHGKLEHLTEKDYKKIYRAFRNNIEFE